jgi:precorrin-2 dehydrogenase / sirohydrochlorin ferrochelatase
MANNFNPRLPCAPLFPMFLRLEGKLCLVVGAGAVAEEKVEGLLTAGARLRVVAPFATQRITRLSRGGKLIWRAREFHQRDLAGVMLVVAATTLPNVNEIVRRAARQAGVPCNTVDDPARCDFFYPAVIRRGPLQIAISTGGRSPALAQQLREHLEQHFGSEFAQLVAALGRERGRLLAAEPDLAKRRELAHKAARRTVSFVAASRERAS